MLSTCDLAKGFICQGRTLDKGYYTQSAPPCQGKILGMKEKRLLLRKTVIQQLRRLLEPALVIIRMHHDGDELLAIAVGRDG